MQKTSPQILGRGCRGSTQIGCLSSPLNADNGAPATLTPLSAGSSEVVFITAPLGEAFSHWLPFSVS